MKSTAQHIHKDGTVCWFDNDLALRPGWWTQLSEDYVDPDYPLEEWPDGHPSMRFPTQNVPCPNPKERGLIEIGCRGEPLVSGDAPYSPPKQKPGPRVTKRKGSTP